VEEEEEGGRQGGQRNTTRSGGFPSESYLAERERERKRESWVLTVLGCEGTVRVFRIWLHMVSRFDEPRREDHNISHLAYRHRLGSQIYKVSISWLLYFVIMLAGGWVQIGQLLNLY